MINYDVLTARDHKEKESKLYEKIKNGINKKKIRRKVKDEE